MGILLYFAAAALLFAACGFLFLLIRLGDLARRQRATLSGVRS